jgi:hypothetical protein
MNAAALIQLFLVLEPLAVPLVKDIAALFKAHPQLTPDQLTALVAAIHSTNADTLATIVADQAAHPVA